MHALWLHTTMLKVIWLQHQRDIFAVTDDRLPAKLQTCEATLCLPSLLLMTDTTGTTDVQIVSVKQH